MFAMIESCFHFVILFGCFDMLNGKYKNSNKQLIIYKVYVTCN